MQGEGDHLTIIGRPYGQGGGGQTSRTFHALSAIHQRPVTLQRIRANRNNSRLRSQHLNGIEVLAHVTGLKIERVRSYIEFLKGLYIVGPERGEHRSEGSTETSSV